MDFVKSTKGDPLGRHGVESLRGGGGGVEWVYLREVDQGKLVRSQVLYHTWVFFTRYWCLTLLTKIDVEFLFFIEEKLTLKSIIFELWFF